MSRSSVTEWTYDHLVKQYTDFLVISIHTICYYRRLYDERYFSLARAYACPVQRCRHPLLRDYINSVVSSIAEEMRRSTVERIQVVILSLQDVPLERFVFDVSALPVVAAEDLHVPFRDTEYQVGQLNGQFRAAIMKLALIETKLGPLPADCTFAVQMVLRPNVKVTTNDAWVEAEVQQQQSTRGKTLVPLRRIEFGPVRLDSWIEETQAKLKLPDTSTTTGTNETT